MIDYRSFLYYNLSAKGEEGIIMDDMILIIAEQLKDLRKDRNLTLEALAEATEISRSALGTYMRLANLKTSARSAS